MAKRTHYTRSILMLILVFSITLLVFLINAIESMFLLRLKFVCTAEVKGVVDEITTGFVRSIDQTEIRYLDEGEGKTVMHIAIEPDSGFSKDGIYANPKNNENIGSEVTIHYSPDDSYDYYINSWLGTYRNTGILTFASGGISFLLILMMKKLRKAQLKEAVSSKKIFFDSPYCTFYFINDVDHGYEGDVEWQGNTAGEKYISIYFDTDSPGPAEKVDYYEMILLKYGGKSDIEYDIKRLASDIAQLRTLLPGKCYARAEKILFDRNRADQEIKKLAAYYFLFKPELIKEYSTEQSLMDGMELSHIGVYRSGDTEFCIYCASGIYADDIRVVFKADGKKEIHYRSYGTDDECCDML